VHKDSGTGWGKWSAVEVKSAIELSFGGQAWVDTQRTQEVQRCGCLANVPAPKVHGKVGVKTGEASNEMALPGVNGFFSCVGAVHVGRCKLELGAFLEHECF
jgi:hypothetical protein